jgi:raffinose/stachyose/melibiose transport system substrate-binding protein
MKRFSVLALCLLFALGWAVPASVTAQATKTITVWDIYPEGAPFRKVLDGAIERFKASHPGFAVNVVSYGDMSNYKTKFATMMAAGARDVDIFQTWGGGQLATYARRGQVLDLTPAMKKDGWIARFSDASLDFVSADGKIWGAPVELANVLFYYNKAMFAKYGIKVPTTFDELLAACQTLKANGIIPIALALNKAEWVGDLFYQYLVTRVGGLDPFRKAIAREPGGSFKDPAFIEAAKLLQKMVDSGCFQDGFLGAEYASIRQLFAQEKAAMTLMGSWLPGQLATEAPAFLPKVDYFRFPAVSGGKGRITDVVGGTNAAFAIAKNSKYQAEALALLNEFTSLKTAADVLGIAKRLPAVKYDYDAATVAALTIRVANELNDSTGIQLYYDQSSTPSLAQVHLAGIAALYAKVTTPEKMTAEWEAAAEKELK